MPARKRETRPIILTLETGGECVYVCYLARALTPQTDSAGMLRKEARTFRSCRRELTLTRILRLTCKALVSLKSVSAFANG